MPKIVNAFMSAHWNLGCGCWRGTKAIKGHSTLPSNKQHNLQYVQQLSATA